MIRKLAEETLEDINPAGVRQVAMWYYLLTMQWSKSFCTMESEETIYYKHKRMSYL